LELFSGHWSNEKIFQESRKLNIAVMQKMVYEEMLPAHFGFNLEKFDKGFLLDLNPKERPTKPFGPRIYNEFAAAAYR
jgi:peroxidase